MHGERNDIPTDSLNIFEHATTPFTSSPYVLAFYRFHSSLHKVNWY